MGQTNTYETNDKSKKQKADFSHLKISPWTHFLGLKNRTYPRKRGHMVTLVYVKPW